MSAITVLARPPAFEAIPPARNTMSTTMAMALALDEGENGHGAFKFSFAIVCLLAPRAWKRLVRV